MRHTPKRLISPQQAMAITGDGKTKFYQNVKDGIYPAPVYTPGSSRAKFDEEEYLALRDRALEERAARVAKGLNPFKHNAPKPAKSDAAERRVA